MEPNINTGFSIYHDLLINSSSKSVFQVVTDPKHLVNWWPQRCTGNPILGAEYNFYFTPEYNWFSQVSKISVDKFIYFKMTKSDLDWDTTTFGFDLEETGARIRLKFSHTGWATCNEHFRTASFCWAMLLNGLKNYVEKGTIVPFEERS